MPEQELDIAETIRIEKSVWTEVVFLAVSALFALACLCVAILVLLPSLVPSSGSWAVRIGCASFMLLGFWLSGSVASMMYRRAFRAPRALVTLSPQGLIDLRISPDTIPWGKVLGASKRWNRLSSYVALSVAPDFEATMKRKGISSMRYAVEKGYGYKTPIETFDLKITTTALLRMIVAYMAAYSAQVVPNPQFQN